MTATSVNGVAVIADEPTPAAFKAPGGKTVLLQQTRTLLLEDGSTTYGCVHCDYTGDSPNKIRPHLNKHRARPAAPASTRGLTLDELIRKVEDMSKLQADHDKWKARALKAEKSLTTLRDALKG